MVWYWGYDKHFSTSMWAWTEQPPINYWYSNMMSFLTNYSTRTCSTLNGQIFISNKPLTRDKFFNLIRASNFKIRNYILSNRLSVLNNKVKLDDLNLSLNNFKSKYKQILINVNQSKQLYPICNLCKAISKWNNITMGLLNVGKFYLEFCQFHVQCVILIQSAMSPIAQ